MKILVIGGTRFFGIHMVQELLRQGHEVTIATRQSKQDPFGDSVKRIKIDRLDPSNLERTLKGKRYDVVYDKIAYCSNDIKSIMDVIDCDKYIYMSSTAVYDPIHNNSREEDFDAVNRDLVWCNRIDFPYDVVKRHAESALWQKYSDRKWIAVRYPYVIGEDDYTGRLLFYVEHAMKGIPMNINNMDAQMGFIRSDEAGQFMAYLADKYFTGAVNGSAHGTISIREILDYVEKKTGKKAVISESGDEAPYNYEPEYSINTDLAESLGYRFSDLKDWIFELLDYYLECK